MNETTMDRIKFGRLSKGDEDQVFSWLHARGMNPHPGQVSDEGYGIWIDDTLVCGVWMYWTNSKISMIDCSATNPSIPKDIRGLAMNVMFSRCEEVAVSKGYSMIRAYASIPVIKERLTDLGYIEVGEGLVSYVKEIE